jgi:hypothetical protein
MLAGASTAERLAALAVAASVLQQAWPRVQAMCKVTFGPNELDAMAAIHWPGVVRVTARWTGELMAQSAPGHPCTLAMPAPPGAPDVAGQAEPVALLTAAWDAFTDGDEERTALGNDLLNKLQGYAEATDDHTPHELAQELIEATDKAILAAEGAVQALRRVVDPAVPAWAVLRPGQGATLPAGAM